MERQRRRGTAGNCAERPGQALATQARHGPVRQRRGGKWNAGEGVTTQAALVEVGSGSARHGNAGLAWHCASTQRLAKQRRHGYTRQVAAALGAVWLRQATRARLGLAWLRSAGCDMAALRRH